MRLASSVALIVHGGTRLQVWPPVEPGAALHLAEVGTGALLLMGFWTPVAGSLVAVLELWNIFSEPGDPWTKILLGSLGSALALLGPGAWSLDSRLFGWKRIHIREHKD